MRGWAGEHSNSSTPTCCLLGRWPADRFTSVFGFSHRVLPPRTCGNPSRCKSLDAFSGHRIELSQNHSIHEHGVVWEYPPLKLTLDTASCKPVFSCCPPRPTLPTLHTATSRVPPGTPHHPPCRGTNIMSIYVIQQQGASSSRLLSAAYLPRSSCLSLRIISPCLAQIYRVSHSRHVLRDDQLPIS